MDNELKLLLQGIKSKYEEVITHIKTIESIDETYCYIRDNNMHRGLCHYIQWFRLRSELVTELYRAASQIINEFKYLNGNYDLGPYIGPYPYLIYETQYRDYMKESFIESLQLRVTYLDLILNKLS